MPSDLQCVQTDELAARGGRTQLLWGSGHVWEVDNLQVWLFTPALWIYRDWLHWFQQSAGCWAESIDPREGQERRTHNRTFLPHSTQETLHNRWSGVHGQKIVFEIQIPFDSVNHLHSHSAKLDRILRLPDWVKTGPVRRIFPDKPQRRPKQSSFSRSPTEALRKRFLGHWKKHD